MSRHLSFFATYPKIRKIKCWYFDLDVMKQISIRGLTEKDGLQKQKKKKKNVQNHKHRKYSVVFTWSLRGLFARWIRIKIVVDETRFRVHTRAMPFVWLPFSTKTLRNITVFAALCVNIIVGTAVLHYYNIPIDILVDSLQPRALSDDLVY